MAEGEVSNEYQPVNLPDEFESDADANLKFVGETILETPLDPEMARSLSRMYTIHTSNVIGEALAQNPGRGIVMAGFKDMLDEAAQNALENGDYKDVERFLRSEAERLGARSDPKLRPNAPLGEKLLQMVELLPK
jgi:hypothetical protein